MTHQQRIEEEFGEPFVDVLLGFAAQGESIASTAGILDMWKADLYKIVDKLGIRDRFPGRYEGNAFLSAAEARRGQSRPAISMKARERELAKNGFWLRGVYDTHRGHCERHGIHHTTARKRIEAGWDREDAITKPVDWRRTRKEGRV